MRRPGGAAILKAAGGVDVKGCKDGGLRVPVWKILYFQKLSIIISLNHPIYQFSNSEPQITPKFKFSLLSRSTNVECMKGWEHKVGYVLANFLSHIMSSLL